MALEKIASIVQVTPFNVTSDSYATFIQNVRVALAGAKPDTVVGPKSKVSRPVLAKEASSSGLQPPKWIHVVLNGKGGAAPTVAIRSDNAYIVGFTNSKGTWYQLSRTGAQEKLVDDNPVMAGFDGNYNTLIGGSDKLLTLNVAKFSVAAAAATCWNHKAGNTSYGDDCGSDEEEESGMLRAGDPLKVAVATLAVAICEAARFVPVSTVIGKGWGEQRVSVTAKEVSYIMDWGDLSRALLKWKSGGYKDDKPFQPFKGIGINNGEEALAVVALLKLMSGSQSLLAWLKCFWGLLVKKLKREDMNYEKPKTAAIVNPL
jgi:hypothetical protein